MRPELREWCEEIGAVLRERRISNNAAAQAIGVSPATFASWMNGATRPGVEALPAVAELTGLALWRVHKLAGYLPENYAPAVAVIQAVKSQRDLYLEMQRWAELSLEATGLSAAARAVGLIIEHDPTWQITIRPNIKGIEYAIASNTILGLERSHPRAEPLHQARTRLDSAIGPRLAALGVTWRNRPVPGWDPQPTLTMEVPEYERTRAPGRAPLPGLPPSIAVLGVPYAHAELVGSLVAEAVDYGYLNTKTEVCVRYGLGMGADRGEVARAAGVMLRENLSRLPGHALDRIVWTCTYPEAFGADLEELFTAGRSQHHVVYVRAQPKLTMFGAQLWGYPDAVCTAAAERLDKLAAKLGPDHCTVVEIPDESVSTGDDLQDRVADAAVGAAIDALGTLAPGSRSVWKGYIRQVLAR
jgi:transcriptional regulator with XRE-family HTH domain